MNEAHQRFHDWLSAGADGDPPRDVAVHASVCAECQQSIAALDLIAGVNPGLASMPAEPTGREWSRLVVAGRLVGATAILFSAAILGVGVSQLVGVSPTHGPVAQASSTPEQSVMGAVATPEPTPEPTPSPPQETLTPLDTPAPTHRPPVMTPAPIRTAAPTPTAPGPPQSPSAVAPGGDGVNLTWQSPAFDGGAPVTSFNVYRANVAGQEALYQGGVIGLSFSDSTATAGTTWFYVITAVNGYGESAWSVEVSATPPPVPTAPGAPTLMSATAGVGVVDLVWSAPASDGGSAVTGYEIWRGTPAGTETLYLTVGNQLTYQDAVATGETYFYRIVAKNSVGTGPLSNELSATAL